MADSLKYWLLRASIEIHVWRTYWIDQWIPWIGMIVNVVLSMLR